MPTELNSREFLRDLLQNTIHTKMIEEAWGFPSYEMPRNYLNSRVQGGYACAFNAKTRDRCTLLFSTFLGIDRTYTCPFPQEMVWQGANWVAGYLSDLVAVEKEPLILHSAEEPSASVWKLRRVYDLLDVTFSALLDQRALPPQTLRDAFVRGGFLSREQGRDGWVTPVQPAAPARRQDALYTIHNRVPYCKQGFQGRQTDLDAIAGHFQAGGGLLILSGMGGIGKSEMAKNYANRYRHLYGAVVFLDYAGSIEETFCDDSRLTIDGIERRVAGNGGIEPSPQYARRKKDALSARRGQKSLLVLDNFDTPGQGESLAEWTDPAYDLLVTSRLEFVDAGYPFQKVEPIRDFDTLRDVFAYYYGKRVPPSEYPRLRALLDIIENHTMAIELIAKQMRRGRKSFQDMIDILKTGRLKGKTKEKIVHNDGEKAKNIYEYLRVLFNTSGLNPSQQQILRRLALVPRTGITAAAFAELCGLDDYDGINALADQSWIQVDEQADTIRLHPLIASVVMEELGVTRDCVPYLDRVRERLRVLPSRRSDRRPPYLEIMRSALAQCELPGAYRLRCLASMLPEVNERTELAEQKQIVEEMGRRLETAGEDPVHNGYRAVQAFYTYRYYLAVGLYKEGYAALEGAERRCNLQEAEQRELYVRICESRAWCLAYTGKLEQAFAIYKDMLQFCENSDDPHVRENVLHLVENDYGVALYRAGRFEESETYQERAMQGYTAIEGENSLKVALALNNLGALCFRLGNYHKALERQTQSLDIRRAVCGEDSRYTALLYDALARTRIELYREEGDERCLDQAEDDLKRSLKTHVRLFTRNSVQAARNYSTYGLLWLAKGEPRRARRYFQDALEIYGNPEWNDDESNIAATRFQLGQCDQRLGDIPAAIDNYRESYAICRRVRGEEHPDALRVKKLLEALEQTES